MPRRVFRWYRPMGSTTGYTLPSRRDEEVTRSSAFEGGVLDGGGHGVMMG